MAKNNCIVIPNAPNGKLSNLFKDVLELTGSRDAAIFAYGYVRTDEFKRKMGDWQGSPSQYNGQLDENGEPVASDLSLTYGDTLFAPADVPRSQPLYELKKIERQNLNTALSTMRSELKNTENIQQKSELRKKIRAMETELEAIEQDMEDILQIEGLEEYEKYAEQDFERLEKIFSQDKISSADLMWAERVIKIWQKAGDFSGEDHLFYDTDELENRLGGLKEVTQKFLGWKARADYLYTQHLLPVQREMVESYVKKTFGEDTKVDMTSPLKDKDFFTYKFLDITETENVLMQAIGTWVQKAQYHAQQEATEISEKLDKLVAESGVKDFSLFMQTFSNTDSRLTGNIVFRWSQKYFDDVRAARELRDRRIAQAMKVNKKRKDAAIKKAYQDFFDGQNKRTINFDVRKLFPDKDLYPDTLFTKKEIEDHKNELLRHLGQKGFDRFMEKAGELVDEFKADLEVVKLEFQTTYQQEIANGDYAQYNAAVEHWEKSHSPYYNAQYSEKGYPSVNILGKWVRPSGKYTVSVPKRFDERGTDTGYYDSKYEQIENNPRMLELYDFILETLNNSKSYLPGHRFSFMQVNSLPIIEKTVMEQFAQDNMLDAMSGVWKEFKKSVRSGDLSDVEYSDIDPLTGEAVNTFQLNYTLNQDHFIEAYVKRKIADYELNNGKPEDTETRRKFRELVDSWRKDAANEIAMKKSKDIPAVAKAFAMQALSFKHKAAIEPQMRVASKLINESLEQIINDSGEQMKDRFGKVMNRVKGLENTQKMLKDFMEISYFGYPARYKEGQSKVRVKTKDEKAIEKELSDLRAKYTEQLQKGGITQDQYDAFMAEAEEQLRNLGGVLTASRVGDLLLKYVQILGLGWNVKAAVANLGFGFISNMIEAADGRSFTVKDYFRAMNVIKSSVLKNITFNAVERPDAKKIRAWMDKLDILKESRYEIYKPTVKSKTGSLKGKLKFLSPYNPNARTEYINQATIMVAVMINEGVWDKVDTDGNIKEGADLSKEQLDRIKLKIDKLNKISHGNYNPDLPLSIKRNFLGRAFTQFRTWAFMGFANRFQAELFDHQLGYERKGRYRSYGTLASALHQVYKDEGGYHATSFVVKQLLRVATFGTIHPKTGEKISLSDLDRANLRKNLMELYLYLGLYALSLVFRAAAKATDDEQKNTTLVYSTFFVINQISRLQTDLLFYSNPSEFEKIQRNALAVFTVVQNADELVDNVSNLLVGGEDTLQNGPNKGDSKTLRSIKKMLPLINQKERLESSYKLIFDKN